MTFFEHAPQLHSFADALGFAINAGWTSVTDICEICGCSDSTVGRWRNEESEPKFSQIMLMIRHHKNARFKMLLLGVLTATTPIKTTLAEVRDFDGNGKIDELDVLTGKLQAADELTTTLNQFNKKIRPKVGAYEFPPQDVMYFRTNIQKIVGDLLSADCMLDSLAAAAMKRKGRGR
jgi:hypothetical protein